VKVVGQTGENKCSFWVGGWVFVEERVWNDLWARRCDRNVKKKNCVTKLCIPLVFVTRDNERTRKWRGRISRSLVWLPPLNISFHCSFFLV